jgi:hypothetical protein
MRSMRVAIMSFCAATSIYGSCVRALADVVVYKESCGHYAETDWNLSCEISKNTLIEAQLYDSVVSWLKDVKSITICAAFGNRGGLGSLTIVYNKKNGEQFVPAQFFETVKFREKRAGLSWIGMSPRYKSNIKVQGTLSYNAGGRTFDYNEIVSSGNSLIGELQASNCNRFFAEEMIDGIEIPQRQK